MKLFQIVYQCKILGQDFTCIQEIHMTGTQTIHFQDREIAKWSFINPGFLQK